MYINGPYFYQDFEVITRTLHINFLHVFIHKPKNPSGLRKSADSCTWLRRSVTAHPKLGSDSKEISSFLSLIVKDSRTQRSTEILPTLVPPTDTPWHMPTRHQPSQSAGRGSSCPLQHCCTNPVLSSSPAGDLLSPGFCPETEHREALTWLVLAPEFHAWKCRSG